MSTKTDTRQVPDHVLQAAIDEACEDTAKTYAVYLNALDITANNTSWPNEATARLHLLKSALARLPDPPPPTADGKTPGQVAYEAWGNEPDEWHKSLCSNWQAAASAVLAAYESAKSGTFPDPLADAVNRMESVTTDDLCLKFRSSSTLGEMAEQVRARLISAAKGGPAMSRQSWSPPEGIDWTRPALHIAKECGVAVTTVLRWMRRNSLAIGPRGAPPGTTWEWSNKLDPATLDWRYQDTALGKAHGVCRERIRQLRKAAGLPASGSVEWLAAGGVVTHPPHLGRKSKLAVDGPPGPA